MSPGQSRTVVALGAGLSLVAIAVVATLSWPFTVDDAFVIASYARHLVAGDGYSFDGVTRSDGVTGPAWLLPHIMGELLNAPPLTTAKVVGVACTLIGVGAVLFRMRRRQGSTRLVIAFGMLCACQADVAAWAVGGLETGAALLVIVVATLAATATRVSRGDAVVLGVSLAAMPWLRPEFALPALVLMACAWTRNRRDVRIVIAFALFGGVGVLLFRFAMFGHWLPLSAFAKPAEFGNGVRYVAGGLGLVTGGIGVVMFARGMALGRTTDRWVGAVAIAHVLAVMLAGGDWMPGFRLLVPMIPLYAWVAAVGIVGVRRRWLATVTLLMCCALPALSLTLQLPRVRASADDREQRGALLASWLREHACRIALVDVGYLVHETQLQAVDLAGITDAAIAYLPGGHVSKHVEPALILERAPDTLLLRAFQERPVTPSLSDLSAGLRWHSLTEHRLAHSTVIASHYRPTHVQRYADGYVYYVLQRIDAQRCPKR